MTIHAEKKALAKGARVLVVDDSSVIRAVISRTINAHQPDMETVGMVANGELAVKSINTLKPDIVVLDVEMPVMDGITAIPLLLKENPDLCIIVCSTLSARGAEISIRALTLGAAECILKPGSNAIVKANDFQRELTNTIRSLYIKQQNRKLKTSLLATQATPPERKFWLRPPVKDRRPAKIVAIGSSTGGPKALMDILGKMTDLPVPIVITQHMPKTFTAMLAQHITQTCKLPCFEGQDGQVIKPGHAYIAPGEFHMTFVKVGENTVIRLNQGPPENFCRPSVNPMLQSLIPIYGSETLAVILTGMGSDGLQSCTALVNNGGMVVAQDEESSVVWGMPGAVAAASLCTAVLPLTRIPEWIRQSVKSV